MNNIIQGFPTPQKDYYKVYVRSITFNQAPYIEDCLNGVAIQETNFPFVHHVIDDASTDGEQDVIKAWMDKNCDMENAEYYDNDICTITIVKNKKDPNCTLAAYFLKKNLHKEKAKKRSLFNLWREVCPYEALCEGDDYWIDPKKLQKQVDWLDEHQNCGLVYAKAGIVDWQGNNKSGSWGGENCKFEDILLKNNIPTLTVLLRINLYNQYNHELKDVLSQKKWKIGDKPMWLWFSLHCQLHFIDEYVGNYRIVIGSASHQPNLERQLAFNACSYDINKYFDEHYNNHKMSDKIKDRYNRDLLKLYALTYHSFRKAFCHFLKLKNRQGRDYKNLIKSIMNRN